MRAAREALAELRAHEQAGRLDVFHGDESGFCLPPTLGCRWQPPGSTLAAGTWAAFCAATANWLTPGGWAAWVPPSSSKHPRPGFLPALRRASLLVLDNGPCHRARLVKAKRAEWRRRGLRLLFLPPHGPHLNRIETLWRLVKHHWLSPSAYATFATLREHVTALPNCCRPQLLSFLLVDA